MAKLVKAGVCKTPIAGSSPAVASPEHQSHPAGALFFLEHFHHSFYNVPDLRYPLTSNPLDMMIAHPTLGKAKLFPHETITVPNT